jgi:predicted RNase H-like nuclease (RuvC/YqgF family)
MIKSKIYFIVPIIAIAVFYGYYWNFSKDYDSRQAQIQAVEKQHRLDKLKAEAEIREKAISEAIEAQKQRKQERIERDALERKQKDDKENARLTAEKADQEAQKLERQVERLTKDVKEVKDEIAKLETEKKNSLAEEAFLRTFVTKAEDNVAKLDDVVKKIEVADAAIAKAAAIAAAQEKKK